MDSYFAAGYWGARREPVEKCAARALKFFGCLSQNWHVFSGWRAQARSRLKAIAADVFDCKSEEEFIKLLLAGRNRKDDDSDVIAELGYRLSLWNGQNEEGAASVTIKCGLYSDVPGLSNSVVLNLPRSFDVEGAEQPAKVLQCLINAWNPEWAVISSQAARNLNLQHAPFLDRLLFVSRGVARPNGLRGNVQEQVLEQGTLFQLGVQSNC